MTGLAIVAAGGRSERIARATIEQHSKSFSLASKLLPRAARFEAQVLYAYCRRADDAVDEVPPARRAAELEALRSELEGIYAGRAFADPLLSAFQAVVQARRIPCSYPRELLAGMEMDVVGVRYESLEQLQRYCYRVAGTVGLMMCHVMGVAGNGALLHATHLGIAMQLTNIARDVLEDWRRGRLYLPRELLERHGAGLVADRIGGPFPREAAPQIARAVEELLEQADVYYASGDAGLSQLSPRCGFAVATAREVYAQIGRELRRRGCNPLAGRAIVPTRTKLRLVVGCAMRALVRELASPMRVRPALPARELVPSREVLALPGGAR